MIPNFPSPSVCVIDEDPRDYGPILDALVRLGIGCTHIKGDSVENLPPSPFTGLRLVFMDLHLSAGPVGRASASHAANVFKSVVSEESPITIVIIWSKHAKDIAQDQLDNADIPPDDQPTEAAVFMEILLEGVPAFKDRLIFIHMEKPHYDDRLDPGPWTEDLKRKIQEQLDNLEAFDVLWSWESLVSNAGTAITNELVEIASPARNTTLQERNSALKSMLTGLSLAQGGPDCTPTSAARHLTSVLAQSLADHLEHSEIVSSLGGHGDWLSTPEEDAPELNVISQINALLLTASTPEQQSPFVPGTVFRVTDPAEFELLMGVPPGKLSHDCYRRTDDGGGLSIRDWKRDVKQVVLELTPACDFHQKTRCQTLLLAGLLVPNAGLPNIKSGEAFQRLPNNSSFRLRWAMDDFQEQDVALVFCSRYKSTMTPNAVPEWLVPWFRLRELPTASLRNWHASHASRVGYVSL